MTELPDGFAVGQRSSPFLDLIGPFAQGVGADDAIVIGLRADSRHLNHRGLVHGAVLTALADIAMGRNIAATSDPPISVVTVTLAVDFIAAAEEGAWLEATATVQRVGRRMAFTQGRITADGKLVAQNSASFAVT